MTITITGGMTFGAMTLVAAPPGAPSTVEYLVVAGGGYRTYQWITSGTITF